MDISSSYSISFHKPYDVKEIHQWIKANDGFEDDVTGIRVFRNENLECISLDEFTALLRPKGIYTLEDNNVFSETFADAMEDLAKKFPKLCFYAHIYFNDYNAGECVIGDFRNKDGEFTAYINDGGYIDEDYSDEDIE